MKVIASDGVKVYDVTSGKSLPQWLSESKKAALRKNDDYQRRLDLLQDFSFPAACQRIKVTPDQNYIFATGYHPPMLKVYDLNNLGLKFDRHLQSEVVDFQILTEDYSKAAFLCADRTISLHARFGTYYTTRVPRYGRDLAYAPFAAELLVSGSSPEVFRISLEEGRFMQPLMSRLPAINASGVSPVHGLFGCAGEGGGLECFDLRQRSSAGFLDAAAACGAPGEDLTAIRYDESGLYVAVGTSNGLVGLFDLRSQKPVVIKDHMYGSKIVDIKFHNGGGQGALGGKRVVSSDTRIVKIWEQSSGLNYTSIEPVDSGDINDICVWPDSGLIMVGLDSSKVQGFFIPSLGPAPRWCHHLEGLTEELEERAPTVYDDFRFVTKEDLSKLGLDHLLGTPMLRAYMHGFFVDNRLYEKAKILTDPFAYETYRQQRVQKKLEEERQSRISLVRKLPKVNAKVAAKLMAQEQADADEMGKGEGERPSKRKGEASVANPLSDDRFKAMFEEDDFVVDEESAEFKMLHPNLPTTGPNKKNAGAREAEPLVSEHFDAVSEEEEESDDSLDDMEEAPARHRPPVRKDKKLKTGPSKNLGVSKGGVEKTMYAAKDAASVEAFRRAVGSNGQGSSHLTLSERAAAQSYQRPRSRVGGSREISFASRSSGRGDRGGGGMRGRGGGGRGRGRGGRGDGGSDRGSDGPSERGGGGGDRGRGRGRSSGGRGRGPGGSGRGRGPSRGGSRGPSRGGSRGGGGGRGRGRR